MSGENAAPVTTITLGQSIVPLNGPWKFHVGDNPQWADPNFDDSQWETVNLTPKAGSFDPVCGISDFVPGWTAKGHPANETKKSKDKRRSRFPAEMTARKAKAKETADSLRE